MSTTSRLHDFLHGVVLRLKSLRKPRLSSKVSDPYGVRALMMSTRNPWLRSRRLAAELEKRLRQVSDLTSSLDDIEARYRESEVGRYKADQAVRKSFADAMQERKARLEAENRLNDLTGTTPVCEGCGHRSGPWVCADEDECMARIGASK